MQEYAGTGGLVLIILRRGIAQSYCSFSLYASTAARQIDKLLDNALWAMKTGLLRCQVGLRDRNNIVN
jgi:hypothetical protein